MADTSISPAAHSDNKMAIAPVDGELRVLDTDLASRLGFAKPAAIRDLIKRHLASLDALGVRATVRKTPDNNGLGGAPATAYYLNRKQAIFITAKSETVNATEITIDIIERFDAYERGAVQAVPQIDLSNPDHLIQLLTSYALDKKALMAQVEADKPKVDGFDRIANAEGRANLTAAAKALHVAPHTFTKWLDTHGWTYKRGTMRLAYQDKLNAGLLDMKVDTVQREDGSDKAVYQVFVTPAGLTRLTRDLAKPLVRANSNDTPSARAVGCEA